MLIVNIYVDGFTKEHRSMLFGLRFIADVLDDVQQCNVWALVVQSLSTSAAQSDIRTVCVLHHSSSRSQCSIFLLAVTFYERRSQ